MKNTAIAIWYYRKETHSKELIGLVRTMDQADEIIENQLEIDNNGRIEVEYIRLGKDVRNIQSFYNPNEGL